MLNDLTVALAGIGLFWKPGNLELLTCCDSPIHHDVPTFWPKDSYAHPLPMDLWNVQPVGRHIRHPIPTVLATMRMHTVQQSRQLGIMLHHHGHLRDAQRHRANLAVTTFTTSAEFRTNALSRRQKFDRMAEKLLPIATYSSCIWHLSTSSIQSLRRKQGVLLRQAARIPRGKHENLQAYMQRSTRQVRRMYLYSGTKHGRWPRSNSITPFHRIAHHKMMPWRPSG